MYNQMIAAKYFACMLRSANVPLLIAGFLVYLLLDEIGLNFYTSWLFLHNILGTTARFARPHASLKIKNARKPR